tara:strand:+ start:1723 stop:2274 length:552 start_codon:yes stop_codon:yes gene_type:complete
MFLKIINFLTISRILIGVIIFILLAFDKNILLAFILFLVAGLTDYFDGFLARKYGLTSQFGEIVDPIADKILIVFVLIGLSIHLSSYLVGFASSIIISREIWVSALRDFNARNNNLNATKVTFLAKLKTSVQLLTIMIYLSGLAFNKMLMIVIGDILIIISLLVTIQTGINYTISSFKIYRKH